MTPPGERRLDVPEGLDGERLDAALARMFGLSRSKAAELIGDGLVLLDGRPAAKSDRVLAGEPLQVTLPTPPPVEPPRAVARPDGETMPREHVSPKDCTRAMRTLTETIHFPVQRRKDGRASLGNASHWMNGDTQQNSREAGAANRTRPLTVL